MKEAVRKVYLIAHKRLLAAMYTCNIQTTSEVLGKLYGVIAKRNGKILEDDMIEGTFSKKLFLISENFLDIFLEYFCFGNFSDFFF